ncbi:MAG: hypothetical protein KF804_10110 [Burkholderiales bacterium]|nr:hypothetical protein [Burkholderiales bacterium]
MRPACIALTALSLLLGTVSPAAARLPAGIAVSGISIGIHRHGYPELVPVPGYPVYYAPQLPVNYFFYDGYYWLYHDDHWYMSDWYDGPWTPVDPDDVPLFVLRVPVRYYMNPPVHFYGWYVDAAPRWETHWGPRWVYYRQRWEHWDSHVVHVLAPLPLYQRHYTGDRYPRGAYRHVIHREHYRYEPRDRVVRERHQRWQGAPRPQVHVRPDFQGNPRPQPERRPDWNRVPSMPPQPLAVPRQPSAVPQQSAALPAPPRVTPPAPQPRFQPQAPRERAERGEFRGPGPQRAAPRPQQAAPRAQQAPRPQFQQRAPQMRGESRQPRGNVERRPGGDRGPGRG